MKIHEFMVTTGCIATILSCRVDSMKFEFCLNAELPDNFRTKNFGPIQDFELPPGKSTDEEFEQYLGTLR